MANLGGGPGGNFRWGGQARHNDYKTPPPPKTLSLPALLLRVFLLAVGLEGGVDFLPEQLYLAGVGKPLGI